MKYLIFLFLFLTVPLFAGDINMNKPFIKDAFLVVNSSIKVSFSERMSEIGLLNIENYTLVASKQTGIDYYSTRKINISSIENIIGDNEETVIVISFIEPLEEFESILVKVVSIKNRSGIIIDLNRNSISRTLTPPLLI